MKSAITWTLAALAAAAVPNRTDAQSHYFPAATGVHNTYAETRLAESINTNRHWTSERAYINATPGR